MKVRDDALERIADALEIKYEAKPYIDVSGVIASDVERIANALAKGFGITTQTLSNGTELNELIRIAEALETRFGVERPFKVDRSTRETLNRIANAIEVGFETGRTPYFPLNRIAIALEKAYECEPKLQVFGTVKDGLGRIADVMECDAFYRVESGDSVPVEEPYDPPVSLIIDTNNIEYEIGDSFDYSEFSASVLRESGKISPVGISEITFSPTEEYEMPCMGLQMLTASYSEGEADEEETEES